MGKRREDGYSGKHAGQQPDLRLAGELRRRSQSGEISCTEAFQAAAALQVPPSAIGTTLDLLEFRIVKCQLGLFGYQPEKRLVEPAAAVPEDLARAIREALAEGRLPCLAAWGLAEKRGLSKLHLAAACEALGIKISACQLGAF